MSINTDQSITRKRKYSDLNNDELDRRPITIKDPSASPFDVPLSLTPLCTLARAKLPLTFLSTASSGSRTFASHVRVLEALHEHDEAYSYVLVAKEQVRGRLYAIERVKRGCYAVCRLAESVGEAEILARSKTSITPPGSIVKRRVTVSSETAMPWWSQAAYEMPSPRCEAETRDTSMPTSSMKPAMAIPCESTQAIESSAKNRTNVIDPSGDRTGSVDLTSDPAPSITDVCKNLAQQYLETLYVSRTSLAYFVKGPLSRARAACTASANLPELIASLRDCVLSSSVMDKKYREGLVDIAKDVLVAGQEAVVASSGAAPIKQKAKKWKSKRTRDGFYTTERDFVERWVRNEMDADVVPTLVEDTAIIIRERAARLRNRETLLQVIVLLETLALEAACPSATMVPKAEATVTTHSTSSEPAVLGDAKHKAKRKQDLQALLETSLDKLCIWQSLHSSSPDKASGDTERGNIDGQTNQLSTFCVEVIVPFYKSRVPKLAAMINKKLGGPTASSPDKPRAPASRRPGEPAARYAPEKAARKPLARVSTDTLNRSRVVSARAATVRHPSLQRSATDSELSFIKREPSRESSQASLDRIPLAAGPLLSQQRQKRANLMPQLSAFSKREVDLYAVSTANEAKARKKRDVEAKLKEAVEMLKKPNRALAVKELEARTDEKFADALSKAKASSRVGDRHTTAMSATAATTNGAHGNNVHIESTPRHVRNVATTPHKHGAKPGTLQLSTSVGSRVPSSSLRGTHAMQSTALPASTPAVPQTGHRPRTSYAAAVHETPSRGFAKFMPAGLARLPGSVTWESPLRRSASLNAVMVQQTPSKPASLQIEHDDGDYRGHVDEDDPRGVYDALGWAVAGDDTYEELT